MSSFLDRFRGKRQGSGATAKQRLQLVLVTDRSELTPDKLQQMKDEIIAVIRKYVHVASDKVAINIEQRDRNNVLVADIPLLKKLDMEALPPITAADDDDA